MDKNHKRLENKKSWEIDFKNFYGWCSLPSWGPYEIGSNLKLFDEISGKTFLEIACGSGHSLKYLLENDAKGVTGVDFSEKQVQLAHNILKDYKNYKIFNTSMEELLNIKDVDCVFSIYGLGWSTDIVNTLENINSYLKEYGQFIFSWDHTFFTCLKEEDQKLFIDRKYYGDEEIFMSNWGGENGGAYVINNTIGTWYSLLLNAGFSVEKIIEPEPFNLNENIEKQGEDLSKYYSRNKVKQIPSTIIFVCRKNKLYGK